MDITEDIWLAITECDLIIQGRYDLTADAMRLRSQRPLVIGDDYTYLFTLRDTLGAAINLTGSTIKFTVKYRYQDADAAALLAKTCTLLTQAGATLGQFTLSILHGDLTATDWIRAYYDIQRTIAGAPSIVSTIIFGDIEFVPDLTRTV
jgi:hypothetical protein